MWREDDDIPAPGPDKCETLKEVLEFEVNIHNVPPVSSSSSWLDGYRTAIENVRRVI